VDQTVTLAPSAASSQPFSLADQYVDDNPTLTASDSYTTKATETDDNIGTGSVSRTVYNVAPQVQRLSTSATVFKEALSDETIAISGVFVDQDILDTHNVTIDWDDGNSSNSVATPSDFTQLNVRGGSFYGTHQYTTGGIFKAVVRLTDDDALYDTQTIENFVTGRRVDPTTGQLQIVGAKGADTITFTSQNVRIEAGDGANRITGTTGTSGNNLIRAGSGNDTIKLTTGSNTTNAGGGANTNTLSIGNNTISAGGGANTITATSGANIITTGDGVDTITTGDYNDVVRSGGGNDVINLSGGNDKVVYTMTENVSATNVFEGGDGFDTLSLELTSDEWLSTAVQSDIANYLAFLVTQSETTSGEGAPAVFEFTAFTLTVSEFEAVEVFIDGQAVDDILKGLADNETLIGTAKSDTFDFNLEGAAEAFINSMNSQVPMLSVAPDSDISAATALLGLFLATNRLSSRANRFKQTVMGDKAHNKDRLQGNELVVAFSDTPCSGATDASEVSFFDTDSGVFVKAKQTVLEEEEEDEFLIYMDMQ
jgi:Ca2+-binding RTX toxin-like protein